MTAANLSRGARRKRARRKAPQPEIQDERFSKAHSDPRFKSLPKRKKKVKVDERFAGLFDDPAFRRSGKIDKYGRKVKLSERNEEMEEFYQLGGEGGAVEEGRVARVASWNRKTSASEANLKRKRIEAQPAAVGSQLQLKVLEGETGGAEDQIAELQDCSEKAEKFARMRGLLEEESDQDSDSADDPLTDAEEDVEPDLSVWGIGAFAANPEEEIIESPPSSRLAVVDLDWDNIRAVDILHIMRCFLPTVGDIKKVSVYISEYGMERMAQEDAKGPGALGLFDTGMQQEGSKQNMADKSSKRGAADSGPGSSVEDGMSSAHESEASDDVNVEKLRIYEKSRLRYHYAVVECDSAETAEHLVHELDGKEFEMSHCKFDLRYIPEETKFDDCQSRDSATDVPNAYEPPVFECNAMTKTNLKLSWDDDDPHRQKQVRRKFCEEDLLRDDIQTYMASDSDRDSMNESAQNPDMIRKHYMQKFGKLEDSCQSDSSTESAGPHAPLAPVDGVNLTDSDLVEVSDEDIESAHEQRMGTPVAQLEDDSEDAEDDLSSDISPGGDTGLVAEPENELTFTFTPEQGLDGAKHVKKSKRRAKDLKDPKTSAELKLLMLDDSSLKAVRAGLGKATIDGSGSKLTKKERTRLSKLEKSMREQGSDDEQFKEDGFRVNLSDNRFAKMFASSDFAIDPTHAAFKRTKGASDVLKEVSKIKRISQQTEQDTYQEKVVDGFPSTELLDLDSMVKKMKRIRPGSLARNSFSQIRGKKQEKPGDEPKT